MGARKRFKLSEKEEILQHEVRLRNYSHTEILDGIKLAEIYYKSDKD
jgi:hypothetical protein